MVEKLLSLRNRNVTGLAIGGMLARSTRLRPATAWQASKMKSKVLFICVHNSARSQMAEAWLNHFCGDFFEAESAGLEPGTLNPLAVEVMQEAGLDISKKKTQAVFDVFKTGGLFAYVITVCDETSAEKCPIFPGPTKRLHWSFPDPAQVSGSRAEKLEQVREIRDQIRFRIVEWCVEVCEPAGAV